MKSPFNDAKLGREALERKVLAHLIDKNAERGNYFPNSDLFPINDCCVSVSTACSYPRDLIYDSFPLVAQDLQCTMKVGHVPCEKTNINGFVNKPH